MTKTELLEAIAEAEEEERECASVVATLKQQLEDGDYEDDEDE